MREKWLLLPVRRAYCTIVLKFTLSMRLSICIRCAFMHSNYLTCSLPCVLPFQRSILCRIEMCVHIWQTDQCSIHELYMKNTWCFEVDTALGNKRRIASIWLFIFAVARIFPVANIEYSIDVRKMAFVRQKRVGWLACRLAGWMVGC